MTDYKASEILSNTEDLKNEASILPFFSDKMILIKFSDYYCLKSQFVNKLSDYFLKDFFRFLIIPRQPEKTPLYSENESFKTIYRDLTMILNEILTNASRGRVEKEGKNCQNELTCKKCNEVTLSVEEDLSTFIFNISNVDYPTPKSYEKITKLIDEFHEITDLPEYSEDYNSFTGGGGLGLTIVKKLLTNYYSVLDFNINSKNTEFIFTINKSHFNIPITPNDADTQPDTPPSKVEFF